MKVDETYENRGKERKRDGGGYEKKVGENKGV